MIEGNVLCVLHHVMTKAPLVTSCVVCNVRTENIKNHDYLQCTIVSGVLLEQALEFNFGWELNNLVTW